MLALSAAARIIKNIYRCRQKNKVCNKRNATVFFKITQNSKVTINVYIARTTYTIPCVHLYIYSRGIMTERKRKIDGRKQKRRESYLSRHETRKKERKREVNAIMYFVVDRVLLPPTWPVVPSEWNAEVNAFRPRLKDRESWGSSRYSDTTSTCDIRVQCRTGERWEKQGKKEEPTLPGLSSLPRLQLASPLLRPGFFEAKRVSRSCHREPLLHAPCCRGCKESDFTSHDTDRSRDLGDRIVELHLQSRKMQHVWVSTRSCAVTSGIEFALQRCIPLADPRGWW